MKWSVFTIVLIITLHFHPDFILAQASFLHFHHLTIADGLSNNRINDIYQDKDGFIWFATDEGLDRFDGKHFVTYRHSSSDVHSLADNIIQSVTGDTSGNIWVSTGSGISCLHPFSGKFDNYYLYLNKSRLITDINKVACLPSGRVIGLADFPRVPRPALYEVDKKNYQLIHLKLPQSPLSLEKQPAVSATLLKDGSIIYQSGSYLFISKDGAVSFQPLNTGMAISSGQHVHHYSLIYADSNFCWLNNDIKGRESQLLAYNYKSHTWKQYVIPHHMMLNQGVSYGDNTYWFSGYTSGLLRLNIVTGKYTRFLHDDNDPGSISDNSIYGSFRDNHGTLWLATEGGVDYWNEKEDKVHYINNKMKGFEQFGGPSWGSLAEDRDGRIWLGTVDYNTKQNGLFSLDPLTMKFHRYSRPAQMENGNIPIWDILPLSKDKLLVSTQGGLFEYNFLTRHYSKKISIPLPADLVRFPTGFTIMKRDSMNNLWFGLWKKGLVQYNSKSRNTVYYHTGASLRPHQLPDDDVGGAAVDDNHILWIIYRDKDLLTGIDINHSKITRQYNLKTNGNDFLNGMACICYGPGRKIWIGTIGKGLICFDPVNGKVVKVYTFSDGLISEIIYSLCVDKKNRLWVYTGKGLQCMKPGEDVFYTVNTDLMPPPGSIEGAPMILTHNGTLFIGYGKNLLYFNPDEVLFPSAVEPPKLLSLQKMGKESFLSPETKVIYIHPKESYIRVSFASLNMLHNRLFRYSYRLSGFNNYWINCGNEGKATFSHLPPGKYSLQMRAMISGLPWNGQYTSLSVIVIPLFYQTTWFQTIILVLMMILITYLIWHISTRKYRLQVIAMKRQQQISGIRNRIAQDIHDDIGAGLTRISIQSELLKQQAVSEKNDYGKILDNISKQAQDMVRSLGEIVWTINPVNDHLGNMLAYFKEYIDRFSEDSKLHYKINFPETEDNRFLHPDIKRNLLMILKESLNNIIKHAEAENVIITFTFTGKDRYTMTIRDDGMCAHETEAWRKGGNGLYNMRSRAEHIHAAFSITKFPDRGVEVKIQGIFYR